MAWLDIAKALPVGHSVRCDCPHCGVDTKTNAAVVNHSPKNYSLYCHACGHNPFDKKGRLTLTELADIKKINKIAEEWNDTKIILPSDITEDIPLEGRLWLYENGITPSTWTENSITYSPKLRRVILPVYDSKQSLCWYQGRAIHNYQRPKYIQPKREREGILFKAKETKHGYKRAVVTEDILSAIRVSTAATSYALMGTKITTEQAVRLSKYDEIVVWLDSDKAGWKGAASICKSLSLLTEVRSVVTKLDPKKLSNIDIRKVIS